MRSFTVTVRLSLSSFVLLGIFRLNRVCVLTGASASSLHPPGVSVFVLHQNGITCLLFILYFNGRIYHCLSVCLIPLFFFYLPCF